MNEPDNHSDELV